MAKALNAALQQYGMEARYYEMTLEEYKSLVDFDLYRNEDDLNVNTWMMKAIKLVYPGNYYAMPRYLTTRDLNDTFRTCGGKTWDAFLNKFLADYSI